MRSRSSVSQLAPLRRPLGVARVAVVASAAMALVAAPAVAFGPPGSFVGSNPTVSEIGPTIPPNGDVNPYGVAVVGRSQGAEVAGDVLVSNFNSGPPPSGLQGRGTTIVQLDPNLGPSATPQVFAQIDPNHLPGACPGGVGLTTALSILPGGWVVVGSLPTSDGSTITGAGCLLVLGNSRNSAALVIGPTGVALDRNGALSVADPLDNRLTAIPFAVFRPNSAGVGIPVS